LNAAYALAKGLGLLQPDPSEMEVFQRWAKLKEKHPDSSIWNGETFIMVEEWHEQNQICGGAGGY